MYYLGQACGIAGTVLTIITPQFRRKMQMLACNAFVNGLNAMNFLLIGQTGSAVFLCLVAVSQSVVSICHEKRGTAVSSLETVLFFLLYVGFGFYGMISIPGFVWEMNRQNLVELLPVIGALMLMLSVFAKEPQRTRLFLLFYAAVWTVYSAITGAAVVFSCVASDISASAALWKYRRKC